MNSSKGFQYTYNILIDCSEFSNEVCYENLSKKTGNTISVTNFNIADGLAIVYPIIKVGVGNII